MNKANEITPAAYADKHSDYGSVIADKFEVTLTNGTKVYADRVEFFTSEAWIGWQDGEWFRINIKLVDYIKAV